MAKEQQSSPSTLGTILAYPMKVLREWQAMEREVVEVARAVGGWSRQLESSLNAINAAVEAWTSGLRQVALQMAKLQVAVRRLVLGLDHRKVIAALELIAPGDAWLVEYCRPYERVIVEEMRLPPLSAEERRWFYLAGLLLDPGDWRTGTRPPLLPLALVAERVDIATAEVLRRRLPDKAFAGFPQLGAETRQDLQGEAFLRLRSNTLPYLAKTVQTLPLASARKCLAEVTRDSYLIACVSRDLRHVLKKGRLQREREVSHPVATETGEPVRIAEFGEWALAIKEAAKRYASRPGAAALDGEVVEAFLRHPELSASAIARKIGAPPRTVQYRLRKLKEYIRQQLREENC